MKMDKGLDRPQRTPYRGAPNWLAGMAALVDNAELPYLAIFIIGAKLKDAKAKRKEKRRRKGERKPKQIGYDPAPLTTKHTHYTVANMPLAGPRPAVIELAGCF